MKEKPDLKLVVDNSKKFEGEVTEKNSGIGKPKTLWEKYNDTAETRDIRKIPAQFDLPPMVQREILQQKERVKNSAETFEDNYNKKIEELQERLSELKNIAGSPEISRSVNIKSVLEKELKQMNDWALSSEQIYENYKKFPEESKFSLEAQEMRDSIIDSLDKILNSSSHLLDSAKKAKDFYNNEHRR